MRLKTWLLTIFLASFFQMASAQQSVYFEELPLQYRKGVDLFEKEMYGAAQKSFEEVIVHPDVTTQMRVNAEFYRAYCALELFNNDAQFMLVDFISKYPESQWNNRIYFLLGKYDYRKKDYDGVINWLSKVDRFGLSEQELTEYQFKLGYSYFMNSEFDKSGRLLYEVKSVESPYLEPATYYFAHIAYARKNYQTALKEFDKLKDAKKFDRVVPYYVSQILYLQGKYDELLVYCLPLLESGSFGQQVAEIERLVGEAHYYTEAYEKALPYLERSVGERNSPSREDLYQLGYTYYRTGSYTKAIQYLGKVASTNDKLGQTASYQLGECYLNTGEKGFAKNAFKAAAKTRFDRDITEDALFNFAKLAYELSYNPYNEAIEAFERYLNDYPDSPKRDEANEFLVSVYMTTRNYEEALSSLDRISKKDFRLQTAYQVIAYNRGVELFLNKEYEKALFVFRKVQKYPFDKKIEAESLYWIAECYYRTRDYEDALYSYRKFQQNGAAYNTSYYYLADYNVGYAYFKTKEYDLALNNFRKFVDAQNQNLKMRCDAFLRIADCYFINKNYDEAIAFYDKAITNGLVSVDYALYQKALCHGFKLEFVDKALTLNQLLKDFPNSEYEVNARYDLGEAYFKSGQNEEALTYFKPLVNEYQGSPYIKKALLQIGLIYYRQKKYDEALNTFKRIAREYPNYDDAKDAIARAQDVYVEIGRIEEYNDWIASLSYYDVSQSELDSINFRAAENIYLAKSCDLSVSALEKYLERFNPGIFGLNAHYYLGECFLKLEQEDKALEHFSFVAKQPVNKFSEPALVATASLNYNRNNYAEALKNYMALERVAEFKTNVLEAQIGQMRCLYQLEQYQSIINLAELVLRNDKTPDEIKLEAMISKAKAFRKLNEVGKAIVAYNEIIRETQTEESAKARFEVAEIYFEQMQYDSVESKIFQLVHAKPSYDYWNAKGFILLAEMYYLQGDAFQAKATLQSIIDYHEGEELKQVAKHKLAAIIEAEAVKEQEKKLELEISVPTEGNENYEELYENEEQKEDETGRDDNTSDSDSTQTSPSTPADKPQVAPNKQEDDEK